MIKLRCMFLCILAVYFLSHPVQSRVSVKFILHLCILLNSLSECIDLCSSHELVMVAVNHTEVSLRERK